MGEETGFVSYSVKELLERIDRKIDALTLSMATKADRAQVESLERRVLALEKNEAGTTGVREYVWRALVTVPGLAALAAHFHH